MRFFKGKSMYVLVALAAAAVTGGVSWADSGGGTIQACVNDTNGNTRIVASAPADCREHESAQTWGITGPQGPQGVPGPPGPQGDRGPSNAYEAFRFFSAVGITSSAWTEVAKIPSLPAGSYVITGKVNVDNALGGSGDVDCQIVADGFFDLGITSIGTDGGQVARATIASTFGTKFSAPTNATLSCRRISGGGSIRAWYAEVVATQVETLTQYAA